MNENIKINNFTLISKKKLFRFCKRTAWPEALTRCDKILFSLDLSETEHSSSNPQPNKYMNDAATQLNRHLAHYWCTYSTGVGSLWGFSFSAITIIDREKHKTEIGASARVTHQR